MPETFHSMILDDAKLIISVNYLTPIWCILYSWVPHPHLLPVARRKQLLHGKQQLYVACQARNFNVSPTVKSWEQSPTLTAECFQKDRMPWQKGCCIFTFSLINRKVMRSRSEEWATEEEEPGTMDPQQLEQSRESRPWHSSTFIH